MLIKIYAIQLLIFFYSLNLFAQSKKEQIRLLQEKVDSTLNVIHEKDSTINKIAVEIGKVQLNLDSTLNVIKIKNLKILSQGKWIDSLRNEITYLDDEKVRRKHIAFLKPKAGDREINVKTFLADLNNDGKDEAIAAYCIHISERDVEDAGIGNAYMNFICFDEGIAVYEKINEQWVLTDAGQISAYLKEGMNYYVTKVENKKIYCIGSDYDSKDPHCCPSLTKSLYLTYENGKIIYPHQVVKTKKKEGY